MTTVVGAPALPRVSRRFITALVLATVGVSMAYVTPMGYSLALRLADIAPGHDEYLGYINSAGAVAYILSAPLLGAFSDRTRSPLGRRRPYLLGGAAVGVLALIVLALAGNIAMLTVGWMLAMLGWANALGALNNLMADRLPMAQRGRVAGLTGFANMAAPVIGIVIVGAVSSNNVLLFLIPGAIGVLTVIFLLRSLGPADDRPAPPDAERPSLRAVVAAYRFSPRAFPDFAWNWAGRFVFFAGLSLNTTFIAFFYAQRLGLTVEDAAGSVALIAGVSIIATMAGAIGGGYLTDRLGRRKIFVVGSAVIFLVSGVVSALFAHDVPLLMLGNLLASLGMGGFSSVDQAIVLDILPHRETDAGRFMAIMQLAQQIPGVLAPLAAPLLLTAGVAGDTKNYTLLYLVGGSLTLVGGLFIQFGVRAVR
ncbi:MFS family permease [Actinoplanes tereljensis]|uniref:MFS transporter n=1 Tax=Paractinoplanes tereljensis TaxID=571912 RepID=A0A919NWB9_9ACTN|nr:MFS transporter [Actinoplanes tereljensis]GIF25543.1 MFS transporter [Actinoplanes tereljensis]